MTSTSAYETLYNNMKKHFTVISDNNEYTLGEYMSMKADIKKESTSNLPAVRSTVIDTHSVAAIFSYVNEKLTVKKAPVKDKTMRAFPFRTSMAAALCGRAHIPACMEGTLAALLCRRLSGQGDRAVSSVKRGDTTITYEQGGSSSMEALLRPFVRLKTPERGRWEC